MPLPVRALIVADPSPELDAAEAEFHADPRGVGIQVIHSAAAALALVRSEPLDVVIAALSDRGAALQVLANARDQRPAAARILLVASQGQFAGLGATSVAHQVIVAGVDASTLTPLITQAAEGAGLISDARLRAIVGGTMQLPMLPASTLALVRLLDDPDTSIGEVVRLLQREPGMAAKALQLVNSAFFNLPRRIASIEQAVVHLGLDAVRTVVMTTAAFSAINGAPESVLNGVRARAILASQVARQILGGRGDDALAAAMLRDVGELLVAARLPRRYAEVQAILRRGGTTDNAAESAAVGATFPQVGACLLSLWGLPPGVVEAVAYCRTAYPPITTPLETRAVVYLAGTLADEALRVRSATLDMGWVEEQGLAERVAAWRRHAEVVSMTWPAT